MGLYFDSIFTDIFVAILAGFVGTYIYMKYVFTYWARKNIEYLPPSFPFGNVSDFVLQRKCVGVVFKDIYNTFKAMKLPYGGFFSLGKPTLMVCDPEMVKLITTKDFEYFHDRDHYIDEENDPLTVHLLALRGMKWKNLRTKLTPAFTSGKMKMMYQLFLQCSTQLTKVIDDHATKTEPINIKEVMARFTTDVIGSCAFGIECNSLINPEAEFRKYGRKIFDSTYNLFIIRMLSATHTGLIKLLGLRQFTADVSNFFQNLVNEIVEHREKNKVDRKDIMNLLIKLKNNESIEDDADETKVVKQKSTSDEGLTIAEVTAQTFVFFFAGFETSSSTMTFCLYELACNQDIQDKLRKEILETLPKYDNETTYEAIMDMPYLDKTIKETLRKYPVASLLNRKCVKDYKIPNTNKVIEKDVNVIVSTLGIHRDPEYYPDPMKFDPERFNEEQKAARPQYTYLPFGEGPRICIGMRFGLLESKLGITSLIRQYKFTLDPRTKTTLELDNKSVLLSSKDVIWLEATKL